MFTTQCGAGDDDSNNKKPLTTHKVFPIHLILGQQLTILGNITQTQTSTGVPGPQPDNTLNNASWMLPANFEDNAFMNEASFSDFFDSLNWVFDGVPDSIIAPPVL